MLPDYSWCILILSNSVVGVTARVDFLTVQFHPCSAAGAFSPTTPLPTSGQGPSLLYRRTVVPNGMDY